MRLSRRGGFRIDDAFVDFVAFLGGGWKGGGLGAYDLWMRMFT